MTEGFVVASVQAVKAPEYDPPTSTHGALSALLAPLVSNGSLAVRAKWLRSAMEFFNVKYCKFSVVNSWNGEENPQYLCSRTMTAAPISCAMTPVVLDVVA
jgi:hypothetical protein